jgi:hypothetical protein
MKILDMSKIGRLISNLILEQRDRLIESDGGNWGDGRRGVITTTNYPHYLLPITN